MTGSQRPLEALRDHTIALETTAPSHDGDGLAALCSDLADARVVGLGESTHGTHEFFALKHRLVRELVAEHGVRTFGHRGVVRRGRTSGRVRPRRRWRG